MAKSPIVFRRRRVSICACASPTGLLSLPYVVENDGLTVLLPEEEKPVIPHGKLRQARGLRRLYNQGVRRLSMENFLWNDLNFPFVVLNGDDGGNGTHKHVGVPIGPDTAIFQ